MRYVLNRCINGFFIFCCFIYTPVVFCQNGINNNRNGIYIEYDSLDGKIAQLQDQLKRQQKSMDAAIYFTRKELERAMFIKAFEEFVLNEELDAAKSLTEKHIEDSKRKKDDQSIVFYTKYLQRWHIEYRKQKLKYQKLFEKEKHFKKEYNTYMKLGTLEAYKKARRVTQLALKYAREQSLPQTIKYLTRYLELIDAKIFDLETPYDLEKLTKRKRYFDHTFNPLVHSDSLKDIQEAGELVDHCYFYTSITKNKLDTVFFARKKKIVASSISDYLDIQELKVDLTKLTDHAIKLRLDTLNPYGIYKWGQYIVVIGSINPQSTFPNVRRGEAIIKSDKQLVKYIEANEIGKVKPSDKMGYTFLIPYVVNNDKEYFLFDTKRDAFQYIVCYTMVVNELFTKEVIKYLPPIQFAEELKGKNTDTDVEKE